MKMQCWGGGGKRLRETDFRRNKSEKIEDFSDKFMKINSFSFHKCLKEFFLVTLLYLKHFINMAV